MSTRGRLYKRGRFWWIDYAAANGERVRESTKCERKADAELLLMEHLRARADGEVPPSQRPDLLFGDLMELARDHYHEEGQRSERLETSIDRLEVSFSGWKASAITTQAMHEFRRARLDAGAARSTINSELSALGLALNRAVAQGLLDRAPKVPRFKKLNNARSGIASETELATIIDNLPSGVAVLIEGAAATGWRTRSELTTRTWADVDLDGGWLRLQPGEGKTKKARMFPLSAVPHIHELLREQYRLKLEIERETGRIIQHVFFYHEGRSRGKPIRDFRKVWAKATKAAGVPDLLVHDLRRVAVKRLLSAGLSTTLCKRFTGHESDSVFDRYALIDLTQLEEAGEQYAAYLADNRAQPDRKVVALGGTRAAHSALEVSHETL